MFWLSFSLVVLGGGGWALWYWWEPINAWIASWNADPEPAPAVVQDTPEPVEAPPTEPEPTKVFGVKGAPEGSETPTEPSTITPPTDPPEDPGGIPVEPLDTVPEAKPASVTVASTSVRGKVSSASVTSRLSAVNEALEGCWKVAAAKPETKRPATLTLSFGIKWNGRSLSTKVEGDAPASVRACVSEALPGSGWPQPRDGGDASVVRSWTLE